MPSSERDFEGTTTKATIRRLWDRPILIQAFHRLMRPLSYFGLPGPHLDDVTDWRDILGPITGVEMLRMGGSDQEADLSRHRRLLANLWRKHIDQFQLLRGTVEDVILDGVDRDGHSPVLNSWQTRDAMRFRYDIVNLDFTGGVGYPGKDGRAKRVRAMRKLFQRQEGTDFVLLLTLNVRDKMDEELTNFLAETSRRIDLRYHDVAAWYAARGGGEKDYKLKAAIPLFLQRAAEDQQFRAEIFPPVAYCGTGNNRMVHFACAFTYSPGNLGAFSQQTEGDLLDLPMMNAEEAVIDFAERQHPGLDISNSVSVLHVMPEPVRSLVRSALKSSADDRTGR